MTDLHILFVILILSIAFIIFMTAKIKMHAFFVLIIASLGVGVFAGLAPDKIIGAMKEGFGNTLGSIGIVIVAGTSLGVVLKKTGAALSMADFILKKVGRKNSSLAMSLTGFIFGIPIFCDSGFVVLSPLNKTLAVRSGTSMAVMAVSLATSLFAVHCMIPPHPGATAAAGIIGVDLGKLMMAGLLLALPVALTGYIWANTFGKKFNNTNASVPVEPDGLIRNTDYPPAFLSFVPVVLPIILISVKSIFALFNNMPGEGFVFNFIAFVGDPAVALIIGLAVSLLLVKNWKKEILDDWLGEGVKDAGTILAITAAGGAFGSILKATGIGVSMGEMLAPLGLGLLLPFLIAAGLKTAQGSSTVAVITTASLVLPLLPELNLTEGWAPVLTLLSMGAGSMIASHANDSYFWVVTKFSGLDLNVSLKAFTTATILMGLTAELIIYLASFALI